MEPLKTFFRGLLKSKVSASKMRHQNHFRVREPRLQNPAQFDDEPVQHARKATEHAQHSQNQKRDRAEKCPSFPNRRIQNDSDWRTQSGRQHEQENHSLVLRELDQPEPERVLPKAKSEGLFQSGEHDSGRNRHFQRRVPDTADPREHRPDRVRICRLEK